MFFVFSNRVFVIWLRGEREVGEGLGRGLERAWGGGWEGFGGELGLYQDPRFGGF